MMIRYLSRLFVQVGYETNNCAQLVFLMVATRNRNRNFIKYTILAYDTLIWLKVFDFLRPMTNLELWKKSSLKNIKELGPILFNDQSENCEIAIALCTPKNAPYARTSHILPNWILHAHHNLRPHITTCRGAAAHRKSCFGIFMSNLQKKNL